LCFALCAAPDGLLHLWPPKIGLSYGDNTYVLGFSFPDEADKQAQYERRVADLRAQVHTRQPKAESKAVVWE